VNDHSHQLPFGVTLLAGRVRDPAVGLDEVRDAERLGFNRVWLSERYDLKEAAVLCGAFAAVTDRIGIGTALVVDSVRHPLMCAAFGATMQATFGDRFTLGLSRGVRSHLEPQGFTYSTAARLEAYTETLRGLWRGELVSYEDHELRFADRLEGPAPRLVYGTFANERGAALAARAFDGVLLVPFMTVEAVERAVGRLRAACERVGRDPATLRVSHYIVTAPDFAADEELAVVNARAVTYLQIPGFGDHIVGGNGWDRARLRALREHPAFTGARGGIADHAFHREQLLEIAAGLPREWMRDGAAIGSPAACCATLRAFLAAGVDEIVFQGSTPLQNAALLETWRTAQFDRERTAA
jgi:5,10-methylenetetrahydromethanopterin reductase